MRADPLGERWKDPKRKAERHRPKSSTANSLLPLWCEILTRGAVWGFFPNLGPEEYPCCRRSRFWPQLLRTELCHRVTWTHAVHSPGHDFFHGQGRQGSQQHSCPAPPSCLSTTCSLQMIPSCVGERATWPTEKAELCPGVCVGRGVNRWKE